MINVVLVDDHKIIRDGVRKILDGLRGVKVVAEAADGEEAVQLVRKHNPDVVVMDVIMPGIGGYEATCRLMGMGSDVKILILTTVNNELFPARLLQAGASGYMTKGSGMEELERAVRAVSAGQRYICADIANKLAFRHVSDKDECPFETLSDRELQVMLMITKGTKVQVIADKLFLSPKTVNSYRYRIFEKLNVKNDVELTLLAIRYGLVDVNETTQ